MTPVKVIECDGSPDFDLFERCGRPTGPVEVILIMPRPYRYTLRLVGFVSGMMIYIVGDIDTRARDAMCIVGTGGLGGPGEPLGGGGGGGFVHSHGAHSRELPRGYPQGHIAGEDGTG